MKEIDFLPEWYKSGKRRQVSYRAQYLALGGVFVVMIVWSFATTRSISQARAHIAQMTANQTQAEKVSAELAAIEEKINVLRKKAGSIEQMDSRIEVASVLGEISYLIDERIVLKKVEFISEKLVDEQEAEKKPGSGSVVRAVRTKSNDKKDLPLGNLRFKVVLAGVAADAGDVAALMCKLEDSPYFSQVVLSYSRGDAKITIENAPLPAKVATDGKEKLEGKNGVKAPLGRSEIQVNEFEINCYLANYRQL